MAVAKRQGREKPAKIEQKKVRGMRTSGKTNDTPGCPISIGQAQGEINIEIEEPKPALSLSLPTPPRTLGRSSLVFGSTCPQASKMGFPAIF